MASKTRFALVTATLPNEEKVKEAEAFLKNDKSHFYGKDLLFANSGTFLSLSFTLTEPERAAAADERLKRVIAYHNGTDCQFSSTLE